MTDDRKVSQPDSKEPPPYPEFGARVRALREKKNESQEELARAVDANVGAISAYERGLRMPHATTIVAIAKHFDVPTDHLLLGEAVVDHHEQEAFHRFLATEYGRIAIKRGYIETLRSMKLPANMQPTVRLYGNLVLTMMASEQDSEVP